MERPEVTTTPEAAAETPAAAEAQNRLLPDDRPMPPEEQAAREAGEGEGETSERLSRNKRYQRKIARLAAELAAARAAEPRLARPDPRSAMLDPAARPAPQPFAGDPRASAADDNAVPIRHDPGAGMPGQRPDPAALHRAEAAHAALAEAYRGRQAEARTELPDFDEVVLAKPLRTEPHVAQTLLDSNMTARLEYFLAKNPDKLAELNRMRPTAAAREIGRLEERLSKPATPAPTQAPAPLAPLRGGFAGPRKALSEMSMDEYAAARKAGRSA